MFNPAYGTLREPIFIGPGSWNTMAPMMRSSYVSSPADNTLTANVIYLYPWYLTRPYNLQRFWWLNGATIGGATTIQAAVMAVDGSNTMDCLVACPRTLSAGTANQLQYATASVVAHGITSGTTTTDATSFATASVALKARHGLMYTLAVVNTHASSANTVTAATTGAALTFTSRRTINYNGTLSRVTLFTLVPSSDVTDTITITIGSAQTATACLWSLVAWTNVDTTTDDGIVQTATGTGTSTASLATLAAFGSANNATAGFHASASSVTPGTGFTEIHDTTASTPACGLEVEYSSANDTTVDGTSSGAAWGSIGAEIKSLGTTRILGPGRYFQAFWTNGGTASFFVSSNAALSSDGIYQMTGVAAGVGLTMTPVSSTLVVHHGITSRASP